ncbi:MAG: acetyl-CoA carboxylase biotin carboxyl carrier protein [Gemmataceae bacterium]
MASTDKSPRPPKPFDVSTVERLIGLMTQNDLSEIDLHDGDSRIRLRRGGPNKVVYAGAAMAAPTAAPAPSSNSVSATQGPAAETKKYHMITSPTPGTFYAKPAPDQDAYVKVGSRVNQDTVVCKIEAMKIFNDIAAECSGVITEILVENAQPVEYGQPLFKVEVA